MYVQNWRYDFYILIGFSLFIGIIIWLFRYDSSRIYIDNKDIEGTLYILYGIAKFNGKNEEFSKIQKKKLKNFNN